MLLLNDRTGVSGGVSQTEEELTAIIYCTSGEVSGFKHELRETHQVKVEELMPRSAQVLRLSSNTAEVGRL